MLTITKLPNKEHVKIKYYHLVMANKSGVLLIAQFYDKIFCLKGPALKYEPMHDKTNKMTCVPREDSDQPGQLSSLIRVFAVLMKKP